MSLKFFERFYKPKKLTIYKAHGNGVTELYTSDNSAKINAWIKARKEEGLIVEADGKII